MRVLFLVNKVLADTIEGTKAGKGHDSWLFGMLRLPRYGIETDYLEVEKFIPKKLANFLRKHFLTMHYAHLPLFPLFFRYDIVFTSTAYSSLILKALLRIKSFKWVVLDFNILGTIGEEKTFREKLFAWAIGKSDGIVAIGEQEAEALKVRYPHLKDKIVFIHEATDTEYFKPDERVPEKNVVLSVGNYGRDFDVVIEATKDLDVECRIATKLISEEEIKKLPPHVTVKLYSHDEILQAYREAKIAFIGIAKKDTHYDSVGTFALIEALSMGKATIVSHTRNMESYVEDGKTAVLVPQYDAMALRKAIEGLLKDEKKRQELGSRARAYAVQYLGAELFAEKLAEFLARINDEKK